MSVSQYNELIARLEQSLQFLPDKPEETAQSTLAALWHLANGRALSAELALATELPLLSESQRGNLGALIERRIGGTPLSHITKRQHFMGLELIAGPQALVPRKETEILARAAIGHATDLASSTPSNSLKVVDVCTGSGNVALAIARHVPRAIVGGADLSEDAIRMAIDNARHTCLADRVSFLAGDLLVPFENEEHLGQVDLLTCNPPYISSARVGQLPAEIGAHEPSLAFDGGPFGVAILMRLLQEAPRYLRPGGWLAFEVGLGQGPALIKRLEKNPSFDRPTAHVDDRGDVRAISARRTCGNEVT